jgi:hypothetical protein
VALIREFQQCLVLSDAWGSSEVASVMRMSHAQQWHDRKEERSEDALASLSGALTTPATCSSEDQAWKVAFEALSTTCRMAFRGNPRADIHRHPDTASTCRDPSVGLDPLRACCLIPPVACPLLSRRDLAASEQYAVVDYSAALSLHLSW